MLKTIIVNDREFLIVKEIEFNNCSYLYLIATDDSNEIALVKRTVENNKTYVESVNDESEFLEVMKIISKEE